MAAGLQVAWAPVPEGTPRRDVAWSLLDQLVPGGALSNVCDLCGGPHGAVRVSGADARVSVGYAGGFAVVAAIPGTTGSALGVDAEPEGSLAAGDALGIRSVRVWTRIEAALKADGRGLRVDPATVRILPGTTGDWTAEVPGAPRRLDGWDAAGPDGVVVSVAIRPVSPEGGAGQAGRPTR